MNIETFNFDLVDKLPPVTVIQTALKQISEATKGYVNGNIETYEGKIHSYTKKVGFAAAMESIQGSSTVEVDIQKDLGVQDKESNRFEVYLSVKGLDLYKYRMMFVDYGTVSYPVKIVMNEELAIEYCGRRKSQFDIASMKELEDMMNKIMDSETFISLVQSLINEALRKESGVIVNDVAEND